MVVDSLIVPECIFRPRSFTGLMTLYESNYVRLTYLISKLDSLPVSLPRSAVSLSDQDCDLYLEIVNRAPYTTTLKLTYWFEAGEEQPVPDPDLTLRVYHDAHLVEAVGGCEAHHHKKLRELAQTHSRELDRRWRSNMMLNKWLDFLIDMGHGFNGLRSG